MAKKPGKSEKKSGKKGVALTPEMAAQLPEGVNPEDLEYLGEGMEEDTSDLNTITNSAAALMAKMTQVIRPEHSISVMTLIWVNGRAFYASNLSAKDLILPLSDVAASLSHAEGIKNDMAAQAFAWYRSSGEVVISSISDTPFAAVHSAYVAVIGSSPEEGMTHEDMIKTIRGIDDGMVVPVRLKIGA